MAWLSFLPPHYHQKCHWPWMKTTSESKFGNNIVLDQNKICQNCTLCLKNQDSRQCLIGRIKTNVFKIQFCWLIMANIIRVHRHLKTVTIPSAYGLQLRGNCTPIGNWVCWLSWNYQLLFEFFNFYKHPEKNVWETLKWHLSFSGPFGTWVFIKTNFCKFWSIIQEPPGLQMFEYHIWVSQTICIKIIFFKQVWWFWDPVQTIFKLGLGCSSP